MPISDQIQREIVDLHQFFEKWLSGDLADTDQNFLRLESALANDFSIVSPDGTEVERATLVDSLRESHGKRPNLNIWIEDFQLLRDEPPLLMVRYDECQTHSDSVTRRVSTALFSVNRSAPNGFAWVRVHETWKADR
ncbi:MAG: hypothetical protein AAF639_18500 [Chloroflexota bacterium]